MSDKAGALRDLEPGRGLIVSELGQSTPEYALVIVLVATVVIGLIPVARESLTRLFKSVIDHVVGLF